MKTILIILITSLFWAFGIFIHREYGEKIERLIEYVSDQPTPQQSTVEKPVDAPTPKPKMRKTPEKNYAELICGYWLPVEGTTSKLDISKYGTVTRYYKLREESTVWYDDRYDYEVSGNKLTINGYYKCTINVFVANGVTYLELYGHEDYAGKYRKRE